MNYKRIIENLKDDIKKYDGGSSHDYYHLIRVFNNTMNISEEMLLNEEEKFIVMASALLHDIGKNAVNNSKEKDEHEKRSAALAKDILLKYDISDAIITKIEHCIVNHRASKKAKTDNILVQILRDADKLDALGAMAIARTFSYDSSRPIYLPEDIPKEVYDGVSNSSLNHIIEKILKITPDTFYTKSAKGIAQKRFEFVKDFVEEFMCEWNGD